MWKILPCYNYRQPIQVWLRLEHKQPSQRWTMFLRGVAGTGLANNLNCELRFMFKCSDLCSFPNLWNNSRCHGITNNHPNSDMKYTQVKHTFCKLCISAKYVASVWGCPNSVRFEIYSRIPHLVINSLCSNITAHDSSNMSKKCRCSTW